MYTWFMAQVTLYLPEEVAAELKRQARQARKSLSALVAERLRPKQAKERWPKDFLGTLGSWEGKFPRIPDEPPEDVPWRR